MQTHLSENSYINLNCFVMNQLCIEINTNQTLYSIPHFYLPFSTRTIDTYLTQHTYSLNYPHIPSFTSNLSRKRKGKKIPVPNTYIKNKKDLLCTIVFLSSLYTFFFLLLIFYFSFPSYRNGH